MKMPVLSKTDKRDITVTALFEQSLIYVFTGRPHLLSETLRDISITTCSLQIFTNVYVISYSRPNG